MLEIKSRSFKYGRGQQFYLLAMEGNSILYNGWYSAREMEEFPECSVSHETIRNRIKDPGNERFKSLWGIIKAQVSETRKIQNKRRQREADQLTEKEMQFINNMALFKAGSLAHTVR